MRKTVTTFQTHRVSGWSQVKHRIVEWRRRLRSRHELEGLSDATLRDIGISPCDTQSEAHKPFWMT